MSKEETAAAKKLRQQPAPDAPSTGKRKRKVPKPWVLEEKYIGGPDKIWAHLGVSKEWRTYRRYAKERDALEALDKHSRDRWTGEVFEYRVVYKESK